jgi:hypothetical protein
MSTVRCVSSFLRDDDDDLAAWPDIGQILLNQIRGIVERHVLEDVGEEQRVECPGDRVLGSSEVFDRIGDTASAPGNIDRRPAGVDPDPVPIEMQQVSADTAAHIEYASRLQASQVPSIGSLNAENVLPPTIAESFQPFRVGIWIRHTIDLQS